jgi:CheY-like chemotaxis protein
MFFEDSDVEIYTAKTAHEGIQAIEEECFDAILCDFGMDDINGLEISKTVMERATQAKRKKTPFLLYTGLDKKLNAQKLRQSGVDLVVNKPVSLEKLSVIIQTIVQD